MSRTIATLAAAAALLSTTPVFAGPRYEVVPKDYQPAPARIVPTPAEVRPFGIPNVGEFSRNPSAAMTAVTVTSYPHETYAFGLPNVGEFCPGSASEAKTLRIARAR